MFLTLKTVKNTYYRKSKLGKLHKYYRNSTLMCMECDSCSKYFERNLKKMDKKRMSNNYFHCCSDCEPKKFAQKKSIERKKIWDMPASLDLPVSKY